MLDERVFGAMLVNDGRVVLRKIAAKCQIVAAYTGASSVEYVTVPAGVDESLFAVGVAKLRLRADGSITVYCTEMTSLTRSYASDSHSRNSSSVSCTVSPGT